MVNIFFRFWQISSFILLLVVFFYGYINFPESIAVNFSETGVPTSFIDKQNYFYWTIGTILGVNFLLLLLSNTVQKLNFSKLFGGKISNDSASPFFKGWFSGLISFINIYLVFVLLGLNKINSRADQTLDFNYNYLLWVGVFGLLIILMLLPYKLLTLAKSSNES